MYKNRAHLSFFQKHSVLRVLAFNGRVACIRITFLPVTNINLGKNIFKNCLKVLERHQKQAVFGVDLMGEPCLYGFFLEILPSPSGA
jgi:hypothetical protein